MWVGYMQMLSSQRWTVPVMKLLPSVPSSPVHTQFWGLGLELICALPAALCGSLAVEALAKTTRLDGEDLLFFCLNPIPVLLLHTDSNRLLLYQQLSLVCSFSNIHKPTLSHLISRRQHQLARCPFPRSSSNLTGTLPLSSEKPAWTPDLLSSVVWVLPAEDISLSIYVLAIPASSLGSSSPTGGHCSLWFYVHDFSILVLCFHPFNTYITVCILNCPCEEKQFFYLYDNKVSIRG